MYLDGTRPGACDMTNIEGRQHSRGAVNLGLSENGAIPDFIHWSIIIFPVKMTFKGYSPFSEETTSHVHSLLDLQKICFSLRPGHYAVRPIQKGARCLGEIQLYRGN